MSTDDETSALAALEQSLSEVETMIRNAHKALAAGQSLDLTPLGDRVTALCEGIRDIVTAATDPDAVTHRLQRMAVDLTNLEETLRANAAAAGLDLDPLTDGVDGPDKDGD